MGQSITLSTKGQPRGYTPSQHSHVTIRAQLWLSLPGDHASSGCSACCAGSSHSECRRHCTVLCRAFFPLHTNAAASSGTQLRHVSALPLLPYIAETRLSRCALCQHRLSLMSCSLYLQLNVITASNTEPFASETMRCKQYSCCQWHTGSNGHHVLKRLDHCTLLCFLLH